MGDISEVVRWWGSVVGVISGGKMLGKEGGREKAGGGVDL